MAWFCCEKALRGVSETVETCFAKGLQHSSCQSERFFYTCKNGRASFIRTAGYLSKKSILRQLAEDLLVFQMCYGEQRNPPSHGTQRADHPLIRILIPDQGLSEGNMLEGPARHQ